MYCSFLFEAAFKYCKNKSPKHTVNGSCGYSLYEYIIPLADIPYFSTADIYPVENLTFVMAA